ncbi:MAG TPA: CHAT domain-containing protein [Thermoanaerobaculia bacterium]|nr:CHAT domain-containing protein [Thermoanaerobaculia bacterium]
MSARSGKTDSGGRRRRNLERIAGWPARTPAGAALLAGAVAGCTLAALACPGRERQGKPLPSRGELAAKLGSWRPVEGRLRDFAYAPWQPAQRRGAVASDEVQMLGDVLRIVPDRDTASSVEGLAEAALLALMAQHYGEAVAKLEDAAKSSPHDPGNWSDLAAAYLARAEADSNPSDYVLALLAADRAVRAGRRLPEARFNRALALECLYLADDAGSDWKVYLDLDPKSGWAGEASDHLRRLAQPSKPEIWRQQAPLLDSAALAGDRATAHRIAAEFPQPAREHLEEEILASWGDDWIRGDAKAAERKLRTAHGIAAALAERGEHLPAEAVAVIDRALAQPGSTSQAAHLARGHRSYAAGRRLQAGFQLELAVDELRLARAELERGGSPFAAAASLYLAVSDYNRRRYDAASKVAREILRQGASCVCPSLRGRSEAVSGMVEFMHADLSSALASYRRALNLFEQNGELQNQVMVETLLAQGLSYLGDGRSSWQYRLRALSKLRDTPDPRRQEALLGESALALRQVPPVAIYFQRAFMKAASKLGDSVLLAWGLVPLSVLEYQLGDRAGARRDLDRAARASASIADPALRGQIEADLLIAQADQESSPGAGAGSRLRALTQAIDLDRGSRNHIRLAEILLARGRTYVAAGELQHAEADIADSITEIERLRGKVPGEPLRISYFETAQPAYDEMIALQAWRYGRPERALDYSERARARALLDAFGGRARDMPGSQPHDATLLASSLPDFEVVVEYALLDQSSVAWVVRRGHIDQVEIPLGAAAASSLLRQLGEAVERDVSGAAAPAAAAELFEKLIKPLLRHLRPDEPIVFIPDKSLYGAPFAALFNKETRRYLVQEHPVAVAPSATFHLICTRRDRALARGAGHGALLIGNPAFDRRSFPRLPPLGGAEAEVQRIADIYPRHQLLIGEAATKKSFLQLAGRHSVVHFAGHSLASLELPLLALAPEGGDSGSLYPNEVTGRHFENTRVMVLAACDTGAAGAGESAGLEGVARMVRPFLAAGVPAVVASLWSVGDQPASELFVAFHRELAAGRDALSALRTAQLSMLRNENPAARRVANWGAFELFGGVMVGSSNQY